MLYSKRSIGIFSCVCLAAATAVGVAAASQPVRHSRPAAARPSQNLSAREYRRAFLKALQLPKDKLANGQAERWAVKVGADADARIDFGAASGPVSTTVEDLAAAPRQARIENVGTRYSPYETTLWTVEGEIVAFGVAPDGDYVLVVRGARPENLSTAEQADYSKLAGTHFEDTIIAAIPDPARVPAASIWRAQIRAVRAQFDQEFSGERHPGPVMRRLFSPVKVRLVGAGFIDFDHGQDGRAPSAVSLHPVLKMDLLSQAAGKLASTPSAR